MRRVRSTKPAAEAVPTDVAPTRFAWTTSTTAIVAVMIGVVFTAALLTAREDGDAPRADVNQVGHEEMAAAPIAMPAIPARNIPQPIAAVKEAPKTVADKTVAAKTVAAPEPPPAGAPVNHAPAAPVIRRVELEREAQASVTISGCLENNEGTFVLTDSSGAAAPTSRSWKSGFLKKRPAPIELAGGVGTLSLPNHVGQRVAATGTLVDREMRVDSVRAIGACK